MLSSPANGVTDFIVTLQSDSRHAIGIVGINSLASEEIGIVFSRQFWGQGMAPEALDCVLDHLFTVRMLEAVTADVEPNNVRCLQLLRKKGFVGQGFKERVWEVGGVWWNALHYRLTKEAWEQREGST